MNERAIEIVLLEADAPTAGAITDAVSADRGLRLAALVRDEGGLLEHAAEADVIVLDLGSLGVEPASVVRDVLARRPDTCLIVTGRNVPATVVGRAIAAGAATYLPKPYAAEELLATIRELRGAVAPRPPAQARTSADRHGALIAVYSPKGGVGTTTIATSLAVALAARGGARVAIVDLDLQFGDVGVVLDLKDASGISEVLAHQGPVDEAVVSEAFARHSSGLYALLAPEEPTDMGSIDVQQVVQLLERMRTAFDFVVCDLWSSLEELALATLRAADRVVLVTTPEVPALRHLRRIMNATAPLLSTDRTVIVANRAPSKVGVSIPEIERALGMPVAVSVPSDGVGVTKAINEGMSMMDPRASVRVARSFRELADLLAKDVSRHRELAPSTAGAAS